MERLQCDRRYENETTFYELFCSRNEGTSKLRPCIRARPSSRPRTASQSKQAKYDSILSPYYTTHPSLHRPYTYPVPCQPTTSPLYPTHFPQAGNPHPAPTKRYIKKTTTTVNKTI